ncbi:DNA helicase RecQ [Halosquirtibacter xylanolyticus]|uniref:DNA helicase RecQ n=1 Tax=Halosquirtibacter xylanolyticus TaxID=3374599 RepID=UPI00374A474B|nr:DNA helicase RecQ [Prolixibacteraceae bacterium]
MDRSISLTDELKKYFGFDRFKGSQEEVIHSILDQNDTFVLMPTGGGKSLCYQLPALISEGTAIVISPLIALMKNQVDAIRSISTNNGIAHFLNSSLSKSATNQVKEDVRNGITKLLYVAPESLTKQENIDFLNEITISFYAIDEAHCISEWGHDFRPEYRRIRPIVHEIGSAPIIALTATATPKVQHDIQKNLGMSNARVFKSSFNRENLFYEIRSKNKAPEQIIKFIKQREGKSGIIYCLSRKKVEELAATLQVNGIRALAYHAGMDSTTRSGNQDKFLMEEVDVIVATIAFGMGIDKPDVRFVIHYDVPKSLEGYYQETGRAGRDGGEGHCLTFYSYKDIQKLEKFMQGKPVAEQEIGQQLLLDTVAFAESAICRRKVLLHYFGESYTVNNCGNCDNCKMPKEQIEGREMILMALNAVKEVKQQYKSEHMVDILTGVKNAAVKSFKHESLDHYGKGEDQDPRLWKAVYRQCIIAGYLHKDIENYGVLKMTPEGEGYIENPHSFMVVKNHDYEAVVEEGLSSPGGNSTGDPELFNMLKDLRKKEAKKRDLPPYILFQESSLSDMSIQYPTKIDELQHIVGVGQGKAKKYGKPFIELIQKYVTENGIIRAQDMVVKSVANKSKNKVFIIQAIDRKMPLDDIANSKGLELNDLISELEAIVNSGTKINIDYYLEQEIDEDAIDDIFDFFHDDSETGELSEAYEELGDDYAEEDIRLVRLKFLSEVGN